MTDVQQTCRTCGAPEHRRRDAQGHELTNISPITGQCVDCLVRSTRARPMPAALPFDAKEAAAGRDAD